MKKFEKIMVLVIVAAMTLALCACGSSSAPASSAPAASAPAASTTTEAAPAAPAASGAKETVKIICPYGVGGVADLIGRKFAEVANNIQDNYTFICENMTGGDGFVANEFFADEDPMEHDLLVFGYGACYRHDLGKTYGTEEVEWDRHNTTPLGTIDDRIWVAYAAPGTTLEDIIAKAQNGGIKMSGGNPLSDPHLCMGSLLSQIGGSVTVVPYDGGAEQRKGLTDGEVDIFMGATLAGKEDVEAGTIVPILTFSENQFKGFIGPDGNVVDVPTIAGAAKAACLPADIDFSGSILPGGGGLASHVGGDADFQAAIIEIIKAVWNEDAFAGWIADYGLNRFEVYGAEADAWYNAACEKSLAAYELLSNG